MNHGRSIIIWCWTTYAKDTEWDSPCGCRNIGSCPPAGFLLSVILSVFLRFWSYHNYYHVRHFLHEIFILISCGGHVYLVCYWSYNFLVKSNAGTKAKEDLASATHAVQVCLFPKYNCVTGIFMKKHQLLSSTGFYWLCKWYLDSCYFVLRGLLAGKCPSSSFLLYLD